MLNGYQQIIVAGIGAAAAVAASFFTASATAEDRVNQIDTRVEVLTERQDLQYRELKESFQRVEAKLDKALK